MFCELENKENKLSRFIDNEYFAVPHSCDIHEKGVRQFVTKKETRGKREGIIYRVKIKEEIYILSRDSLQCAKLQYAFYRTKHRIYNVFYNFEPKPSM